MYSLENGFAESDWFEFVQRLERALPKNWAGRFWGGQKWTTQP